MLLLFQAFQALLHQRGHSTAAVSSPFFEDQYQCSYLELRKAFPAVIGESSKETVKNEPEILLSGGAPAARARKLVLDNLSINGFCCTGYLFGAKVQSQRRARGVELPAPQFSAAVECTQSTLELTLRLVAGSRKPKRGGQPR